MCELVGVLISCILLAGLLAMHISYMCKKLQTVSDITDEREKHTLHRLQLETQEQRNRKQEIVVMASSVLWTTTRKQVKGNVAVYKVLNIETRHNYAS